MRQTLSFCYEIRALRLILSLGSLLSWFSWLLISTSAQAQSPPITPSGLNTVVTTHGTTHNITGGTRPGGGENLFHSFSNFDVPTNNIANFLNDTGLLTSNILGRVTDPNPTNILGTIQTTGFGNANLFLMNPTGVLFGPTASLNVGGSVTFTTADYMRFADNGQFNALPNIATDALLSIAPVAAYGFLGSNPGAITIQGSQVTVPGGQGLSLVGGNITIQSGIKEDMSAQPAKLSAPGGQINLVSVTSSGEILKSHLDSSPNMRFGSITLSKDSLLDVSANSAGTVRIRGGQFLLNQATISADTTQANGNPVAIDINLTGDLSITAIDVPALTARTTGSGNAGEIRVSSANMNAKANGANNFFTPVIDTHSSASGTSGAMRIVTGTLSAMGDPTGASLVFFVDTGTSGVTTGPGGNVTITANQIQAQDIILATTGNFVASLNNTEGAGTAGNTTITADNFQMVRSQIVTDGGEAGSITVNGHTINLDASSLSSAGQKRGGAITLNTNNLHAVDGDIITQTNLLNGGAVNITGATIALTTGSTVVSSTGGNGHAGPITIIATDHLRLLSEPVPNSPSGIFNDPSGIFSNSSGLNGGTLGSAGDILVIAPRLELTNGSRIDTATATSGRGGNVTIQGTDLVSMAGETGAFAPDILFTLGALQPSGIFTRTTGGHCTGPCGNAGNVLITTDSLKMGSGSQINIGTSSNGQAGTITIDAASLISMSGTLTTGQPGGIQSRTIGTSPDAGSGGNISLTAGRSVTIQDGASVSASSTGPGNAGNISIDAGQRFDMQDSSVTTEAKLASGGNIDIKAVDLIRVANGQISSSVQGGPSTAGGNITIDPKTVVLQNAQILAKADQGNGGNIQITTPLFLKDSTSIIDASSQFGLSGTVTIQSPTSNLSGTVGQLASKTNPPQVLSQNRCIALAGGEQSTFILAGRDTLLSEPGGWLKSPMSMEHWTGEVPEEHVSRLMVRNRGWNTQPPLVMAKDKTSVLSLRRLTPPGFLVRLFATGTTGCPS